MRLSDISLRSGVWRFYRDNGPIWFRQIDAYERDRLPDAPTEGNTRLTAKK